MALLHLDGFDHATTATIRSKYDLDANHTSHIIVSSPSRTLRALRLSNSGGAELATKLLPVSGATCILGVALYVDDVLSNGAGVIFLRIREGATNHVYLTLHNDGTISVRRGDDTVLATTTYALSPLGWYYLELKATIHDSAGAVELRIDESVKASASGVDTQNGGTAAWDKVQLEGACSLTFTYYDDFYVCDGSGAANNDFLGACRVDTLVAVDDATAAGTSADFTPLSGTDHGAMVDEAQADEDTSYNAGTAVAQKDTYRLSALTLSGAIKGIQVNNYCRKTEAGARTIKAVVRSDGTDYEQTEREPITTYTFLSDALETDPATASAWLAAGINAMEAGLKVES